MFHQAQKFSIHGGQFFINSGMGVLPDSTLNQNGTITYEKIRLATPAAPIVFTGRNELVAEAVQELCQNIQAHIAILGAGGMGKTALALHILKDDAIREKFEGKIYFVPCELFSDALSLIQGLVQALKLSVTEGQSPYEILEKHLELSHDPMLIVLDNFETPWHKARDQNTILNLIEQIMSQEFVSILLTMRATEGPGNYKWYKLGGHSGLPTLDLSAAKQAFMLISNSRGEDAEKLDWLLKEVDCMPLAILLIAQLKKYLSLDMLIEKWKSLKTNMLKTGVAASRQTNLSTSINISLDILLQSRNNDCIKILPILSFLPNGVPLWHETLSELIVEPNIDIEESVMSLLEFALVYEEQNSLKMLSPIREDLKHKYPTQENHLRQIGSFYMNLLDHYSPAKGQNVIEDHISNITKTLEIQLQNSPGQEYLFALYDFANYTRFSSISIGLIDIALTQRWDDSFEEEIKLRFSKEEKLFWMGAYKKGADEIETIQLILKDVGVQHNELSKAKNLARCTQRLGNICRMQDEYSKAELLLTDAKVQFEKLGDQVGAARCAQSLGDILGAQNKYAEAELLLIDAKAQFENIGAQAWVAQCLKSLGDLCRMQNDHVEAMILLTDAKTQFEKVGSLLGAAQCLLRMGYIYEVQDEYSEAELLLTDAKAKFEMVGSPLGAAQCLQSLGNIFCMRNEYIEAKLLLTDAKNQFEKVGSQLGAAQCLQSLGDICHMQNEYAVARLLLTDAKTQFEKIGYLLGGAQCLRSLGDLCCMQNEYSEAKILLTDAKAQTEKIGSQLGAAQCLQSLGNLYRMQDKYLEAKIILTDARAQFQKIGHQLGAAQCLRSLGDICYMHHEYLEAKLLLTVAKSQLQKVGNQRGVAQCQQSLGNICYMQDKFLEATLLLTNAKAQFEKIGHLLGAAECLLTLGDICYMQNKYSEARLLLTDAQAYFEKLGHQIQAARCFQTLRDIYTGKL